MQCRIGSFIVCSTKFREQVPYCLANSPAAGPDPNADPDPDADADADAEPIP